MINLYPDSLSQALPQSANRRCHHHMSETSEHRIGADSLSELEGQKKPGQSAAQETDGDGGGSGGALIGSVPARPEDITASLHTPPMGLLKPSWLEATEGICLWE